MLTKIKNCSLEKAISYQNSDIVYRFTKNYDIEFDEANDIFLETKKWLWLINQADSTKLAITDPLLIIDEMWHNFILFTVEYTKYCFDRFGFYVHHAPTPQSEQIERQKQLKNNLARSREEQMQKLRQQCTFICEKLGKSTLLKWYVEYPKIYNENFFNNCRQKVSLYYTPDRSIQSLSEQIKTGRIIITNTNKSC